MESIDVQLKSQKTSWIEKTNFRFVQMINFFNSKNQLNVVEDVKTYNITFLEEFQKIWIDWPFSKKKKTDSDKMFEQIKEVLNRELLLLKEDDSNKDVKPVNQDQENELFRIALSNFAAHIKEVVHAFDQMYTKETQADRDRVISWISSNKDKARKLGIKAPEVDDTENEVSFTLKDNKGRIIIQEKVKEQKSGSKKNNEKDSLQKKEIIKQVEERKKEEALKTNQKETTVQKETVQNTEQKENTQNQKGKGKKKTGSQKETTKNDEISDKDQKGSEAEAETKIEREKSNEVINDQVKENKASAKNEEELNSLKKKLEETRQIVQDYKSIIKEKEEDIKKLESQIQKLEKKSEKS